MSNVVYLTGSNCGAPIPVDVGHPLLLPYFTMRIPAGFPSPAEDYEEAKLNILNRIITRPAASYYMDVIGHSMTGAGITDGAVVIVDRSIQPVPGQVVVAIVNNQYTLKRLMHEDGAYYLKAENSVYPALRFAEGDTLEIWGVATYSINPLNKA